jgi:hypothetical protein
MWWRAPHRLDLLRELLRAQEGAQGERGLDPHGQLRVAEARHDVLERGEQVLRTRALWIRRRPAIGVRAEGAGLTCG